MAISGQREQYAYPPLPRAARASSRARWAQRLLRALLYVVVVGAAVVFMIPFLWALSTSLKSTTDLVRIPPILIPQPLRFENYPQLFEIVPLWRFAFNTMRITFINVVGQVLVSAAVAYGFARHRFRGRNLLFLVLLATTMLPREVTAIPTYLLFNKLRWIDTYYPLILPHLFGIPFAVFLMRQFFLTIPFDLDEAAKIDGAGSAQIFRYVLLPLSIPALATNAIFAFIGNWNDLWNPLIYLNSTEKFTLALGLTWFQAQGYNFSKEHWVMAYSILMTAPILLLFFFTQRYFIQGIVLTANK